MSNQPPTEGPDWDSSDWDRSDWARAPTQPIPGQQPYLDQPHPGPPHAAQPPYAAQAPYAGQQPYPGQQPYRGQGPPGGPRSGSKVVWVVLGVLAVVMVLVVGSCAAAVLLFRGAATEVQERADRFLEESGPTVPTFEAPVPPPVPEGPVVPSPSAPAPEEGSLALGGRADIGSLAVVVTEFTPDATAEYEATGEDPPEFGQFGKVTVEVTNTGDADVLIGLGLSMGLLAADGTEYASLSCRATLSDDVLFTTAEPGETVVGTTCVDIPAAAVAGGRIYGQQLIDFGGSSRAFWTY